MKNCLNRRHPHQGHSYELRDIHAYTHVWDAVERASSHDVGWRRLGKGRAAPAPPRSLVVSLHEARPAAAITCAIHNHLHCHHLTPCTHHHRQVLQYTLIAFRPPHTSPCRLLQLPASSARPRAPPPAPSFARARPMHSTSRPAVPPFLSPGPLSPLGLLSPLLPERPASCPTPRTRARLSASRLPLR